MDKEKIISQCERWHEEDVHLSIIDTIQAIPATERDYELTSLLARAYNNVGDYHEAIRLLEQVKEAGEKDIFWYYRMGFAYEGLRYKRREYLEKAIFYLEEALRKDVILQNDNIASEIHEMLSNLHTMQEENKSDKAMDKEANSLKVEKKVEEIKQSFLIKDTAKASSSSIRTPKDMAFHIIEDMKKTICQPAISISLQSAKELSLTQSKVSGFPYLPQGESIPTGTEGRQLSLLAQINCAELPENEIYPKEGILQFWFLDDLGFCIDWDDLTKQDNFRVLYYPSLGAHYTEDVLVKMLHPYHGDEPFFRENQQYEMTFTRSQSFPYFFSEDFQHEFISRWNERCEPKLQWLDDLEELEEELVEEICEAIDAGEARHQIGGYAKFTQDDPRENSALYKPFQMLLLQIDSQFNEAEHQWEFLFGDAGICNFFIEPERLRKCDFSTVMFTMDCY